MNPSEDNISKQAIEDFWPEIAEVTNLRSPRTILSEQATLLGQKTQNIVIAQLSQLKIDKPGMVCFGFDLIAPALSHYRYRLFKVFYSIVSMYPVTFVGDVVEKHYDTRNVEAVSETDFCSVFKSLLQHAHTKLVIESLLAQSEGLDVTDDDIPF